MDIALQSIESLAYSVVISIFQDCEAYNKGAFKIQIDFPAEYPFKPPKITFKTKIYHPNIDEKGQVCLPIISAENWKPATKTDQGMKFLSCFFGSCLTAWCQLTLTTLFDCLPFCSSFFVTIAGLNEVYKMCLKQY